MIEKKKKMGRKEKKEQNFSNTWTGAPTRMYEVSVDDRKYQNQTLVIITQYLKYKRNKGELGPYVFFFSLHNITLKFLN